jgi:6-phosphogluconolactonase
LTVEIERHPDLPALAAAAALRFAAAARTAVAARGEFLAALSGGRTPQALYEALSRPPQAAPVPWADTHLFWGDERCVPLDDPRSNHFLAQAHLLSRVPVPPRQIHPAPAEVPAAEAAARWEAELRGFFAPRQPEAAFPAFDLILLGVGSDGHVASLFPGDPALDERERWTAAVAPQGDPAVARLTLTLPVLVAAREVLVLAADRDKLRLLEAVAAGEPATRALPVARLARRPLRCLVSA